MPFTVPAVPTGMKAGVSMTPCGVVKAAQAGARRIGLQHFEVKTHGWTVTAMTWTALAARGAAGGIDPAGSFFLGHQRERICVTVSAPLAASKCGAKPAASSPGWPPLAVAPLRMRASPAPTRRRASSRQNPVRASARPMRSRAGPPLETVSRRPDIAEHRRVRGIPQPLDAIVQFAVRALRA